MFPSYKPQWRNFWGVNAPTFLDRRQDLTLALLKMQRMVTIFEEFSCRGMLPNPSKTNLTLPPPSPHFKMKLDATELLPGDQALCDIYIVLGLVAELVGLATLFMLSSRAQIKESKTGKL